MYDCIKMVKKAMNGFLKMIEEKALMSIFVVLVTSFFSLIVVLTNDHFKLRQIDGSMLKMDRKLTAISFSINDMNKNMLTRELLDAKLKLREQRDDELQREIDEFRWNKVLPGYSMRKDNTTSQIKLLDTTKYYNVCLVLKN